MIRQRQPKGHANSVASSLLPLSSTKILAAQAGGSHVPRPAARTRTRRPRARAERLARAEMPRAFFARRDDDDDRVRCNRRGSRNERAEPVGAVQLPGIRPAPDRSAHAPGSGCMGYVATGGSARGYGAFGRRGPDRRLIDDRPAAAKDGRHAKCCVGRTRMFRTWRT